MTVIIKCSMVLRAILHAQGMTTGCDVHIITGFQTGGWLQPLLSRARCCAPLHINIQLTIF